MKNILFIIIFGIFLCGCASPKENYMPTSTPISEPPLNTISTVSVGDIMLRQGVYSEHEAIFVPQQITAGGYTIYPGNYLKTGENGASEFFFPGGPEPGRVDKAPLADNWKNVMIKNNVPPEICVVTVFNTAIVTCSTGNLFERRKVQSARSDSFQQTLIYSGKIGDKVNVGYREFSSSLARPAFNNNVEYDLSESKVIGYKGAQIEIIEATNQHIKFKMLKNFNAAVR